MMDTDRSARLHEFLAQDGRGDLAEMLLWPALAALSASAAPPGVGLELTALNARTRVCAASFIRLAADVLALQDETTATREVWRETVVTLAAAFRDTSGLLAEVEHDDGRAALTALLRQMLSVGELVADWLEGTETPTEVSAASQFHDSPPPPPVVQQQRRRPWFSTEVEGTLP
jgi:hypothetical protein